MVAITMIIVIMLPSSSSSVETNARTVALFQEDFYKENGTCRDRRPVGEGCTYDDQCVKYAVCSSEVAGVCVCQTGFYEEDSLCGGRESSSFHLVCVCVC